MKSAHLESLIAVQQTQSINKAGALLHTTPQNVSKLLRQFEDELGFALIIRTPHGITLTQAGLEVLSFAKVTLENLDNIKRKYASGQRRAGAVMLCWAKFIFSGGFFCFSSKNPPPPPSGNRQC